MGRYRGQLVSNGFDAHIPGVLIVLAETFTIARPRLGLRSLGRDRRIDGRAYKRIGGG